jgi:hypothetical protein
MEISNENLVVAIAKSVHESREPGTVFVPENDGENRTMTRVITRAFLEILLGLRKQGG